jgi:hypothetical protein
MMVRGMVQTMPGPISAKSMMQWGDGALLKHLHVAPIFKAYLVMGFLRTKGDKLVLKGPRRDDHC